MRTPRARRLAVLTTMFALGAGVLPAVMTTSAGAAPDDEAFSSLRGFEPTGAKVRVEPRDYAASRVDFAALRGDLPATGSSSVISVPDPSGVLQSFRVSRTQVMESELAAAHPEIATFAGRGIDDPGASIALDLTPMGFHVFVRSPGNGRDWYVDPAYNRRGTTAHLSYFGSALPRPDKRRAEGEIQALRETVTEAQRAGAGQPVARRYFRLALTSDPTYAAYFGTANVLAEKVTLINRVNEIYNDDLGVELRLVNGTDALNLDTDAEATGANGPCGTAPCFTPYDDNGTPIEADDIPGELTFCSGSTLGKNRTVLGQLIGASNYDVGHVALGVNGGGVAYLGVIGGDYKGGGCTGLPEPKGDFFAIDYVAHEIGHQFGGNHTFNGALGACGGNISDASVEPGSGSSVMAYAGICGQDDLQPHTDPYFSFLTVDEAYAVMDQTSYDNVEVQTVSLRDFDQAGDSFTLQVDGVTTEPIVRGANYNAVGIKLAIEAVSDKTVSIAQWGYDQYNHPVLPYAPPTAPDDAGFQVIFNALPTIEAAGGTDVAAMGVTGAAGGVSGFVGETAQGGPSHAQGIPLDSDNTNPVATAPADKTVPIRTPFALSGTGTDPDGDSLIYLWEQTNFGEGTQLADNTKVYGPLFRVFGDDAVVSDADALKSPSPGINLADGSPMRVFPDMAQVLAGNTNAASGDCPAATTPLNKQLPDPLLDCYSEFLPDTDYLGSLDADDRKMQFRLTARDLAPLGGGLAYDDVTLTVDPAAGPFLVTSQASGAAVARGSAVPITWAVNNTQGLAPTVKISLSTDGGASFGTVLAPATPNDGTETLTMPDVDATNVRIKIEAVGNYFFDVNDAAFALVAPATPPAPTTPPAPGVPDTVITAGPADGSVVLDQVQSLDYVSTVAPATFVCRVDDEKVPCAADGVTETYSAGTHDFSVAAVNAAGVADPTPATRSFTVPIESHALAQKGVWDQVKKKAAYGGSYVTSHDLGAKLVARIHDATKITLVVSTRRKAGSVTVFIGKKRIKTFSLKGRNRVNRLRQIVLDKPRSGKVKVVVSERKPVRIEGLAITTNDR
ncbi:reprolysin-like metallopeptidase [Nocardioides sp.]|uniref:reprolysin-like metallopeptidase n=1 Tax=Nocardioides sp. TaxID=35761 RepID=UPI002BF520F7|nr:M12 family metallo-peptidase [Nocardioides sp.]HXH79913.1 M12 family metallo-peptidase [Nocardioides sp.]